MGNTPPSIESDASRREKEGEKSHDSTANKAQQMVQGVHKSLKDTIKNFDADSSVFDKMCGPMFDSDDKIRQQRSYYSDDLSEDDSRTVSEDDTYIKNRDTRQKVRNRDEDASVFSQSDYESGTDAGRSMRSAESFETEDDSLSHAKWKNRGSNNGVVSESKPISGISKPLASSFAKRCYFTKAGIGKSTQHYEGLTLTGNVVLMLAAAMKLKGCPTICDEDLRRVEQTYPNQFSRLPDELLLSSGWRRISKYCHFSNKPIPDGVPFFHSKQRLHPSGGFYFLLAAAVGMIRPLDVEPLTRDTLVLLETDYPNQCDAAPSQLKEDSDEWMLVDKFCFFSGGPINTEEDVYYMADFDGNPIYMLAFLSPSLTPDELYKLTGNNLEEPGLQSVAAVEDVESVYDLTERDFDDLKLYHLGPCRALPPHILQPQAWTKVLPPHFLSAKHRARELAENWEQLHGVSSSRPDLNDDNIGQYEGSPEISDSQGGLQDNYSQPEFDSVTHQYSDTENSKPFNTGMENGYAFNVTPGMVPGSSSDGNGFSPPSDMVSPSITQNTAGFFEPSEEESQFSSLGGTMERTSPGDSQQSSSKEYFTPAQAPSTGTESLLSQGYSSTPASQKEDTYDSYYEPETSQHDHAQIKAPLSDQISSDAESSFQREVEEEGAFADPSVPIDEAIANRRMVRPSSPCDQKSSMSPQGYHISDDIFKLDPPDDEPPSLSRDETDNEIPDDEAYQEKTSYYTSAETEMESDEILESESTPGTMSDFNEDDAEYYESPEKEMEPSGSEEYHSREGEYYDSPEHQSNHSNSDAYTPEDQGSRHYTPTSHGKGFFCDDNEKPDQSCASQAESPLTQSTTPNSTPQETPESDFNDSPHDESYDSGHMVDESHTEEPMLPDDELSPKSDLVSKSSPNSTSEHSRSAALRSAQDLLRKSRQRRLEKANERNDQLNEQASILSEHDFESYDNSDRGTPVSSNSKGETRRASPEEEKKTGSPSSACESGSEMTSVMSGSSVWTDSSNAVDRSSRRALILQMAKARMKQNKSSASVAERKTSNTIVEEESQIPNVSNAEFDMSQELD